MRLLLVNGRADRPVRAVFDRLATEIRARGVEVDTIPEAAADGSDVDGHELLVSHLAIPAGLDDHLRCVGGRRLTRPAGLGMLADAGVPTMRWSLAATKDEVLALFDDWCVDRLLLKRSGTHAGQGTFVFDRSAVSTMRWRPTADVICPEVNAESGDVFKIEVIAGVVVICWVSEAPTIAEQYEGGVLRGLDGAYGDRTRCEIDDDVVERVCAFSRSAAERGQGYASIDFMRRPDGALEAIEINPNDVATWWTSRFDFFFDRYADAVVSLCG